MRSPIKFASIGASELLSFAEESAGDVEIVGAVEEAKAAAFLLIEVVRRTVDMGNDAADRLAVTVSGGDLILVIRGPG